MIRFKGRQHMKVYVKNKPVKWGFKSYTLRDSNTAFNCNFEMYIGGAMDVSQHGLTYDLVMRLMTPYLKQGYQLLTDNYYTSHSLAQALKANDSELVGTVRSNRRGFPDRLKSTKQFKKKVRAFHIINNGIIIMQAAKMVKCENSDKYS